MRDQTSQTLYVSDLNGTLLQPDATLSASCRRRLARLLEQGVQFTVATVRSISDFLAWTRLAFQSSQR